MKNEMLNGENGAFIAWVEDFQWVCEKRMAKWKDQNGGLYLLYFYFEKLKKRAVYIAVYCCGHKPTAANKAFFLIFAEFERLLYVICCGP